MGLCRRGTAPDRAGVFPLASAFWEDQLQRPQEEAWAITAVTRWVFFFSWWWNPGPAQHPPQVAGGITGLWPGSHVINRYRTDLCFSQAAAGQ